MKKILIIASIMLIGITSRAQQATIITNDNTGWQKIAQTTVRFEKEKDEIVVLGADRFAAIKIKATEAAVQVLKLEVHYETGDLQEIAVDKLISKDIESQSLDLNGGERNLKKVVFHYKTQPNSANQKAHVELWGLKTNTD